MNIKISIRNSTNKLRNFLIQAIRHWPHCLPISRHVCTTVLASKGCLHEVALNWWPLNYCILYTTSIMIPWNILKFNFRQTIQRIIIILTPVDPETTSFFIHHKCSMGPPWLIRLTSNLWSSSFHTRVSMSQSNSATTAVIRSRSSWRLAGIGGTKSDLYKSKQEKIAKC